MLLVDLSDCCLHITEGVVAASLAVVTHSMILHGVAAVFIVSVLGREVDVQGSVDCRFAHFVTECRVTEHRVFVGASSLRCLRPLRDLHNYF